MQKQVNIFQAIGKVGTWVNDALKSAVAYPLKGSTYVDAMKASGVLTFNANAVAGDIIVINGQEYTFTAEPDNASFLVTVGASADDSASTLASAIAATNPYVTARGVGSTTVIEARNGGVAGNEIVIESSNSSIVVTDMSGGADAVPANNATVGRAFTYSTDGSVKMGGANDFAGILVNTESIALYNGLTPTLQVPDGTSSVLAKSGYIFVQLTNASNVGDKIYFSQADGSLGAGTAGAGQTQIAGAQVVTGGSAGDVVKIGFIPQVA